MSETKPEAELDLVPEAELDPVTANVCTLGGR
jgi:hypothetical protein